MPRVQLLVGPARSGKTALLLAAYREALSAGPAGAALWLAPTHRHVQQLRGRLLDGSLTACFQPQCYTFGQLASQVLAASSLVVRPLGRLEQRELLRGLIDGALSDGRLRYFAPIAQTAGFLDLLVRFIRELKRLEIWPEAFSEARVATRAAAPRGAGPDKQAELAALYGDYQELLGRHDLYDAEGRFWSARFLLREGQTRPLDKVRQVFVDGFTDFTRTEHEILEILAQRADSLLFTLPLEPEPRRTELFDKAERTRAELARRHPGLETIERPRPAAVWPALTHFEANIFRSPRCVPPAPAMARVELLSAASQQAELEAIAARVKRLLVQGDPDWDGAPVQPGQIVVALRSLAGCEELIGEVFGEFGIPLALEGARPLARSGRLAAITALIELERGDWPYRSLLHVLGSNYLRPDWPECRDAAARGAALRFVRAVQVPIGKRTLLERVDVAAARDTGARGRPGLPASGRLAETQAGQALLRRLGQALERLPQRATASGWAQALKHLASEVGLFHPEEPQVESSSRGGDLSAEVAEIERDRAAWDAALAALRSGEQLAAWLGQDPRQLDRNEFWQRWQDILALQPLPERRDDAGCVRVLSAPSVRGLEVDYLFLAGLGEQSFPLSAGGHGLLSEPEVALLGAAGLPLPTLGERSRDEMLLFYEVLTRPNRRLTLSYPALDASAQPLTPSPYLFELQQICRGAFAVTSPGPQQLSPVPTSDEPLSLRDLRLMAVSRGQAGDVNYLAELLRRQRADAGAGGNLAAGLLVTEERGRDTFGPHEGLLLSPAVRRELAERFGPDLCWSASRLEEYAGCPYQFYLKRVLGLKPVAELELAVDYLARGSLLHDTLAALHRRLNERSGSPASLAELDEQELLDEVAAIFEASGSALLSRSSLDQAFAEIDRRLLMALLPGYLAQHRKYEAALAAAVGSPRPAHFEVEFGPGPQADSAQPDEAAARLPTDPLSTTAPFRLESGGQTVLLSGRIDRIDVVDAGGQLLFNIIDYKSGGARHYSAGAVQAGRVLQLPLYALAAAELLLAGQAARPWLAGYWFPKDSGFKEAVQCHDLAAGQWLPTADWEALRQQLTERVLAAVRGIRSGYFPVDSADEKCTSTCEFKTVCRVNQVRSLEKVWQPPAEEPR